jgi:hypothetical protein
LRAVFVDEFVGVDDIITLFGRGRGLGAAGAAKQNKQSDQNTLEIFHNKREAPTAFSVQFQSRGNFLSGSKPKPLEAARPVVRERDFPGSTDIFQHQIT